MTELTQEARDLLTVWGWMKKDKEGFFAFRPNVGLRIHLWTGERRDVWVGHEKVFEVFPDIHAAAEWVRSQETA